MSKDAQYSIAQNIFLEYYSNLPFAIITPMTTLDAFDRVEPGARKTHKREILRAALACFVESGIDATTMDTIRARAESSVGSMYHHFGNKEGLLAAIYLAALDDQMRLIAPRVEAASDTRGAIAALIGSYLEWVEHEPQMARFLFQARHHVAAGPQQQALAERNQQRYASLHRRLAEGVKDGTVLKLPREVYASLLIGPAENYCRAWLSGRVKGTPTRHGEIFVDAAWRMIAAQ